MGAKVDEGWVPIPKGAIVPVTTTGCPESSLLALMQQTGPPFLFAVHGAKIAPGARFTLMGYLFQVVREVGAEEWRDRLPQNRKQRFLVPPRCYIEAATD